VDDLAQVGVALLRLQRDRIARRAVADRDEQIAVLRIDRDARTDLAASAFGHGTV
jgi:hypothetical protein